MPLMRDFIDRVTSRESDPINQARAQMLFYLLFAYFFFGLSLVVAYGYTGQIPQLVRAIVISVLATAFLYVHYTFNVWRVLSHIALILITVLGVWANILIYVQGINAATLQYIWLACAFGFYMHGSRVGWVYAVINIAPVLIDAAFFSKDYFFLGAGPQVVARPIYIYVLIYDFFAIAFLHYFFFKVFNRNIATLTETKNQLNDTNEKLNKTIEEIRELSNVRMRFLSTMSHELRTPLNGVIGLTNVLLHQEPRKDQEETLSVLRFSAENLLALVNDILDFNKLDSDVVELESTPFNLHDLIENIYAATKLKASEKQLDFTFEVAEPLRHLTLIGDPTRITQVLLNLLNNAIKFTEKGSVKLNCSQLAFTDESVEIRFVVEDTGIGIEESRQHGIFDEFVQASVSTTRNYGGTGLGLPIVKRVLELYQSAVQIESSIGNGARFSFDIVFPYQKDAVDDLKSSGVKEGKSSDLSKLKVLVVEDNAINIMVINKTLNRMQINPDIAENGKTALEMINANYYDLILMDLYMPELDGYETTKLIRSLDNAQKAVTPIIALTATVNSQVLDDVLAVGMNGYLSKPFHPDDLFEELRKHVN